MRILLSAYSCEPQRGSEPGLGWNTAVELARDHDVWVITKGRQREPIEKELAARPQDRLHVVYYELPWGLRWIARREAFVQLHYYLWQYGVYFLARRLCRENNFDVACHVTFGRFWSPSLFALLPVPFIWGGVGGGETVPPALRPCLSLKHRALEWLKTSAFRLYRFDPFVRLTARRAALIVVNHPQTAGRLTVLTKAPLEFMETAVVDRSGIAMIDGLEEPPPRQAEDPVVFATLTRLLHWKGVHLGLRAFQRLNNPNARYLVLGDGPERPSLERLARELGIERQVEFLGNASRVEWMRALKTCHAMVHPSLANAFNTIVLEAMLCGRPTISFETEYMREKLGGDTTYFVDWPEPEAAINGLAAAMRQVIGRPEEARQRGARGRERALVLFTWDRRTQRLNRFLRQVAGGEVVAEPPKIAAAQREESHAL